MPALCAVSVSRTYNGNMAVLSAGRLISTRLKPRANKSYDIFM